MHREVVWRMLVEYRSLMLIVIYARAEEEEASVCMCVCVPGTGRHWPTPREVTTTLESERVGGGARASVGVGHREDDTESWR